MRNPFKTQVALIITPQGRYEIKVPFLRKLQARFLKNKETIRGRHYDAVIIDEVVEL